jgi:hypothetical protein
VGRAWPSMHLREGRISSADAEQTPCLIDFGLLHPDPDDMRWLHATAPAAALPRLLRTFEDRVKEQQAASLTRAAPP